jgi:hypothetical protein
VNLLSGTGVFQVLRPPLVVKYGVSNLFRKIAHWMIRGQGRYVVIGSGMHMTEAHRFDMPLELLLLPFLPQKPVHKQSTTTD